MESNWYRFAKYAEETYGTFVDYEERFFECPECGEPIYESDWQDTDYWLGKSYNKKWYCPICENRLGKF